MGDRIRFLYNRIKEHLWVKPLVICIFSIIIAFLAKLADQIQFLEAVPEVSVTSLTVLLSITTGSMLGVATFAVGSMLTAYSSASNSATPRSFLLIIADDVSQNTLSSFIGAFIFSIVAYVALENGYYGPAGRFFLFIMSVVVFVIIILNFISWLDRIARLGQLGNTIEKVEAVTKETLLRRRKNPYFSAEPAIDKQVDGTPIYSDTVGYVQRIDVPILQSIAEETDIHIRIAAQPGVFTAPDQPLAYIELNQNTDAQVVDKKSIERAFTIAKDRAFDEDPRFGLVVLSEIASRALSAAVNDPGTAIDIIGSFVRLFTLLSEVEEEEIDEDIAFNRVSIPELSLNDMFDNSFNGIARDGAGTIEVALRLQKAFRSLASLNYPNITEVSKAHAQLAFRYAEKALTLEEEIELIRKEVELVDTN